MTATPNRPSLGIKRLAAIHYYVHDLSRSRRFYTEMMDFKEVAISGEELETKGKQRSSVFVAGECSVVCSEPIGEGGRAARYLKRHPDGVGALAFEVENIEHTFALLDKRGATITDDIQRTKLPGGGEHLTFSIVTPFGDTNFRFLERRGTEELIPGMIPSTHPYGGGNVFGFTSFDHVTSNFGTMSPAVLWLEHMMGCERYWEVAFHTQDVGGGDHGSGLRSQVMWDPSSGLKFAMNEPVRPFFKDSQIYIFREDHRGDGVQHAALSVRNILECVKGMRERGIQFMPTPPSYYEMLPERLQKTGIGTLDEEISVLKDLEILVDGGGRSKYLLQIFLRDSAGLYREPQAGPFFFEIIQRKGDAGFGAGNFRALFESIEREQTSSGTGGRSE